MTKAVDGIVAVETWLEWVVDDTAAQRSPSVTVPLM